MKSKYELNYKDLRVTCNPKMFNFTTTDELEPINTGIGQEKGIKALEFGTFFFFEIVSKAVFV